MIPMVMRMDICKRERSAIRLWIPLFLIWIIVLALLLVALPFLLIAALAVKSRMPGARFLPAVPAFFGVVNALSGLRIDVESRGAEKVFISFD